MLIRYCSLLLFISPCLSSLAQEKIWVFLRDKKDVSFDPFSYFDAKAITRRQIEGLTLFDSTDFPLNENYVNQVLQHCDSMVGQSRWFNAIACVANPAQQVALQLLPCVSRIEPMMYKANIASLTRAEDKDPDTRIAKLLQGQTEVMQTNLLHEKGYKGQGIRVAVFDAGFSGMLNDDNFKHIAFSNRIKATYDFVTDKKFVFHGHYHGTHVLSCIAGMHNDKVMGCAMEAEFLLARTEHAAWESHAEEENWVMALEWADKWGADIINSSLGYTNQFYFSKEMDGKHSIISRAASMAAHKGILVCNSAGNEGDGKWEVIAAPADADSVLTIGGVDSGTCLHASFSSYGPTADLRMKPNLSAFGYAAVSHNNDISVDIGTSFSSPLVAGFAACIKQMHPEWPLKRLYDELQRSGHLYPYYDYAHGYGIPQGRYFVNAGSIVTESDSLGIDIVYMSESNSFSLRINDNKLTEIVETQEAKHIEVNKERRQNSFIEPGYYTGMQHYLHWHVEDTNGTLLYYESLIPAADSAIIIKDNYDDDCTLRVHWRGCTLSSSIGDLKL